MRPVLLFMVLMPSAVAARAEDGRWIAGLDVVQSNITCMRTYRCAPLRPVKLAQDEKIVSTATQRVAGVCARGIGPLTSCTQCLTNPPKERCTWQVVKK